MTPIRYLTFLVIGAACASSWWAAAIWGNLSPTENGIRPHGLWVLASVLTVILLLLGMIYCFVHWEDD